MAQKRLYYINGTGIISPQKTFDPDVFLTEISWYNKNVLTCVVPDFKAYINPIQMRRLSRMLRIGLSAATICLRGSGVKMPDGIITATGYGFLDETAKFLNEVLTQSEKQLTPTYFMQSTSNALAGLVALTIKCMGYNNTYASKGFAFENALNDAMMQLNDKPSANILVGSYDEAAEVQYRASIRAGHFKEEQIESKALFSSHTKGTLQGEGSAFFMLSGVPSASTLSTVVDMQLIYKPEEDELHESLRSFLGSNEVTTDDIDIVVSGASGDVEHDAVINKLIRSELPKSFEVKFKHLCGEYTTATAFALWLTSAMFKKQQIPEALIFHSGAKPTKLERALVINQYRSKSFSFVLMTR